MVKIPAGIGLKKGKVSEILHSKRFVEIMTWSVPPVTPLIRYGIDKKDYFKKTNAPPEVQDKKKKLLKRDLVRDTSIYSLGTGLYFGTGMAINYGLKKLTKVSEANRKVSAFLGALAVNVVYVSAIASKLSKKILQMQKGKDATPDEFIASQKLKSIPATPIFRENTSFKAMPKAKSNEFLNPVSINTGSKAKIIDHREKDSFMFKSVYNKLDKEGA